MKKERMDGLIVFVVLHYLTHKDTVRCVDAIKEKCSGPLKIVIVDNCSENKSGQILEEKYQNDADVVLLRNEKNLGFAKGNNVGFKYAKDNFRPDFIILTNNDVILLDDLREEIYKKYAETRYAVLGPKEYLEDGSCFFLNPELMSKTELKNCMEQYEYRKKHAVRVAVLETWSDLKNKIKKKKVSVGISPDSEVLRKELKNVVLHGAFLVFSRVYIDLFDGLDDRTFMYGEESLLAIRLKKHNLLSIYDPRIEVLHNHGSATKVMSWNKAKRIRRRAEYELDSAKVFLKELESSTEY